MDVADRKRVSAAVIGCGAVIEEIYLPALHALADSGWTLWFVDRDLGRANSLAARFAGASAEESLDRVLDRVSHAIVATPPAAHYPVCVRLLGAGIHVLCEKPFVLDPAEGTDLVQRATAAHLKLQVNQTRRWYPAALAARKLLGEGALGTLQSVSFRDGIRFNWPAKTAFHSQPGLTRNGILSDQGSHVFDLIGWIVGEALEPLAVAHDGYAGPEATVSIDFRVGSATGHATLTWLLGVPTQLRFTGTNGQITLGEDCNVALLETNGRTQEVGGPLRYAGYPAIIADMVNAFVGGSDQTSVAWAASVLPAVKFLDLAYRMGAPTLPFVTALGRTSS